MEEVLHQTFDTDASGLTFGGTDGSWVVTGGSLIEYAEAQKYSTAMDDFDPRLDTEVFVTMRQGIRSSSAIALQSDGTFNPSFSTTTDFEYPVRTTGVLVHWNGYTGGSVEVNGVKVATDTVPALDYDTWKDVRIRFKDGILYVKVWNNGSAEPESWGYTLDLSGHNIQPGNAVLYAARPNTSYTVNSQFATLTVWSLDQPYFRGWGMPMR